MELAEGCFIKGDPPEGELIPQQAQGEMFFGVLTTGIHGVRPHQRILVPPGACFFPSNSLQ